MKRVEFFTLLELLIVISIVVILIGILLPLLKSTKDKAYTTVCSGNLRQLAMATAEYQADWGGEIPYGDILGDGSPCRSGLETWRSLFEKHFPKKNGIPNLVYRCPSHSYYSKYPGKYLYTRNDYLDGILAGSSGYYFSAKRIGQPSAILIYADAHEFNIGGAGSFRMSVSTSRKTGYWHRIMFTQGSFLDGHVGFQRGISINTIEKSLEIDVKFLKGNL